MLHVQKFKKELIAGKYSFRSLQDSIYDAEEEGHRDEWMPEFFDSLEKVPDQEVFMHHDDFIILVNDEMNDPEHSTNPDILRKATRFFTRCVSVQEFIDINGRGRLQ